MITPPVTRLRRELGYPGMVVLQFAFDPDDPRGPHRLENHRDDVVAYTGTHDTDTLRGWWSTLEAPRRARGARGASSAAGFGDDDIDWALIRLWMSSPAPLVMLQVQDVLGPGLRGADEPARGRRAARGSSRCGTGQLTARHAAAAARGDRGGGPACRR